MNIIDRRAATATTYQTMDKRNIFSHGNRSARRNVARIRAVILHQTDFVSSDLDRFNHVIANFVVMQNGCVLYIRDLSMGLNSIGTVQRAVDIEFVGNYTSSASATSHLPSTAQLNAGRELLTYLRERYSAITQVFAHAHFRAKNCPGPHIWYNVGRWGLRNGMVVGDSATRHLPQSWTAPSLAILDDPEDEPDSDVIAPIGGLKGKGQGKEQGGANKAQTHVVQRGESLTAIARRYGFSSWREIYYHDSNSEFRRRRPNPNLIHPHDVLVIPNR